MERLARRSRMSPYDGLLVYSQHDSERLHSNRLGKQARTGNMCRIRHVLHKQPSRWRNCFRIIRGHILSTLRRCSGSHSFAISRRFSLFQLVHAEWCSWTSRSKHMAYNDKIARGWMEHRCELVARKRLESSICLPKLRKITLGQSYCPCDAYSSPEQLFLWSNFMRSNTKRNLR